MSYRRKALYGGGLLVLAPVMLAVMILQLDYFFAKPSLYTAFNAVVADWDVDVERGISFDRDQRLKLDVYSPKSAGVATPDGPVVLFIYGGSWTEGERAYYGFVGASLASRGIETVIPDYRLFPKVQFPGFVDDVAAAYAWTVGRFRKADGSPRPIVVMGHSAGAHMAAMIAFNADFIRKNDVGIPMPSGLIGMAGPYAFDLTTYPSTKDIFRPGQPVDETIPLNYADRSAPPTLLLHGAADTTVKVWNTEQLQDRLEAANVPVRVSLLDGVTHVELVTRLAWPYRDSSPVLDLIENFVRSRGTK